MSERTQLPIRNLRRAGIAAVVGGLLFGALAVLASLNESGISEQYAVFMILVPVVLVIGGTMVVLNAGPIERGRFVKLAVGATVLTIAVIVGWMALIGSGRLPDEPVFVKLLSSSSVAAIGMCIAIQLFAAEVRTSLLRGAFVALAFWVASYSAWIVLILWTEALQNRIEIVGPATGMLGLFTAVAIICARVVVTWKRQSARSETVAAKPKLRMTCPRCQIEQVHTTGPVRCPKCRFLIVIEIQEPRCECGYLLYQLHGKTCPECGRVIADDQRLKVITPDQTPALSAPPEVLPAPSSARAVSLHEDSTSR